MARYPTCPFCRKREAAPSKEDIFAKWMARLWPDRGRFVIERFTGTAQAPDRIWGAKGNMGFVLKMPCERCNNGWMSVLEQRAAEILTPMILQQPKSVNYSEAQVIAQWIVKTAIMFEFYQNRESRYFKPSDRFTLYKMGTVPRALVFLAHHAALQHSGWFYEYPLPLTMTTADGTLVADAYVATFTVGHLTLQLFTHRYAVAHLQFHLPGDWNNIAIQIWPNRLGTERPWPPELALDDAGLKMFSDRWRSLKPTP